MDINDPKDSLLELKQKGEGHFNKWCKVKESMEVGYFW